MSENPTDLDSEAAVINPISTTKSLLVMIPAFNEEQAIGAVVRDVRSQVSPNVVVVDDGSSDRTAAVAEAAGARVLKLPFNLGVGGAIRTALSYADRAGFERVIQIDGDGQHDIDSARLLLEPLDNGYELVVGSRFASGYDLGNSRRFAMRVLSRVVSRRLGVKITDTTSGHRAMGRRAIELFARDYPVDYLSDTVEALLIAADHNIKVIEVDVPMYQRQSGTPSSSAVKSSYHLARLLLAIFLHTLRRKEKD